SHLSPPLITFLLADNQDITRAGLRAYIADTFGEAGCCRLEVANKKALIEALTTHRDCTVVILDYALFDLASVEELLNLGRRFPEVAWLLCSNELSDALIRRLSAEHHVGMIL
ncbi:hypothetical protein T229_02440, partial [Tannerella sp. oral taxon BU063 isolate Cell 5]